MPATVKQAWGSSLSKDSGELFFKVRGTENVEEARGGVLAAVGTDVPSTLNGKILDEIEVDEVDDVPGLFLARVSYTTNPTGELPQAGEKEFEFDTGGGTERVKQALHTERYPAGAPDYKGAINVSGTNVEGVDKITRAFAFSVVRYIAPDDVTSEFLNDLYQLSGTINNAAITIEVMPGKSITFAENELLFLRAAGSQRGNEDLVLRMYFAASPTVTGLTIGEGGSAITGINKAGWSYLWAHYATVEDAAAKVLVQNPDAVYVQRVYENKDFTKLGVHETP